MKGKLELGDGTVIEAYSGEFSRGDLKVSEVKIVVGDDSTIVELDEEVWWDSVTDNILNQLASEVVRRKSADDDIIDLNNLKQRKPEQDTKIYKTIAALAVLQPTTRKHMGNILGFKNVGNGVSEGYIQPVAEGELTQYVLTAKGWKALLSNTGDDVYHECFNIMGESNVWDYMESLESIVRTTFTDEESSEDANVLDFDEEAENRE